MRWLQTEFGGLVWLPFALLGLMLCIGYAILRFQQDRKKRKRRREFMDFESSKPEPKPGTLEAELREEFELARKKGEHEALDLPPEEREKQERIRQALEEESERQEPS